MTFQPLSEVTRVVIHHSASPRHTTTAQIRHWHTRDNGWQDIGYHYVIEQDGRIHCGRPIDHIPAAQRGFNTGSVAICITGDNTRDEYKWNLLQKQSLRDLISCLRKLLPNPFTIFGHRDLPGAATLCPGLDVRSEFPDLCEPSSP